MLRNILVLTLANQVHTLRREHPHVEVRPIQFALRELGLEGLRLLLGLDADQSPLYVRQVECLLRDLLKKGPLTFKRLLRAIRKAKFLGSGRQLLLNRLALVRPWINDDQELRREVSSLLEYDRPDDQSLRGAVCLVAAAAL